MEQKISLAEVVNRFDISEKGTFYARIDAEGSEVLPVNYVSPYASNSEGAMVALPEIGVEVLVCKPIGSNSWYYLGATFAPPLSKKLKENTDDSKKTAMQRVLDLYGATGFPMKMAFLGKFGEGLVISEEKAKNPKIINLKTVLKGITTKHLSIIDSPMLDCIIMDTGKGSKITLTANPENALIGPPNKAIMVETLGPQRYLNYESQTDIEVIDGRDLNILNSSTGYNALPGSEKFGNVNIQSDTNDINIFTTKGPTPVSPNGPRTATDGRIFIECLNPEGIDQVIQLQTAGASPNCVIRLRSSGKVEIQSLLGDIDLISAGSINLLAGTGNINMTAPAGEVNIQGTAGINADGETINLNSGQSTPAVPTPGFDFSYYYPFGIFTPRNGMINPVDTE